MPKQNYSPMNIKYEKYLSMEDVPAGKILDVILKKRNISQSIKNMYIFYYSKRVEIQI